MVGENYFNLRYLKIISQDSKKKSIKEESVLNFSKVNIEEIENLELIKEKKAIDILNSRKKYKNFRKWWNVWKENKKKKINIVMVKKDGLSNIIYLVLKIYQKNNIQNKKWLMDLT